MTPSEHLNFIGYWSVMTTVGGKFTAQKRNLVTYIEPKHYELLKELAAQRGSSVSAEAAIAIQNYLNQNRDNIEGSVSNN